MLGTDAKIYSNLGNPDVIKLIEGSHNAILDIGCGAGDNAKILSAVDGNVIDGITLSESELKLAKQYLRSGYIYNLENGLPPDIPDEFYDYIICSHVLEHIAYPQGLLKDIFRTLKKNGRLIVALPNIFLLQKPARINKG